MTTEQANEVLKTLFNYYKTFQINLEIGEEVTKLYLDTLKIFKFDIFKPIIQELIKNEKYFPKISTLDDYYNKKLHQKKAEKSYHEKKYSSCNVCEGNGYIVLKRDEGDYIAYCTQCKAGQDWNIDLRENPLRKSPYYTKPITAFYDVSNLIQKKRNEQSVSINLQKLIAQIGSMEVKEII